MAIYTTNPTFSAAPMANGGVPGVVTATYPGIPTNPQVIAAPMNPVIPTTSPPPLQHFAVQPNQNFPIQQVNTMNPPMIPSQLPPPIPVARAVLPPSTMAPTVASTTAQIQQPVSQNLTHVQAQLQTAVQKLPTATSAIVNPTGATNEVKTIKMTGPAVPMTAELKPAEVIPTGPVMFILLS